MTDTDRPKDRYRYLRDRQSQRDKVTDKMRQSQITQTSERQPQTDRQGDIQTHKDEQIN